MFSNKVPVLLVALGYFEHFFLREHLVPARVKAAPWSESIVDYWFAPRPCALNGSCGADTHTQHQVVQQMAEKKILQCFLSIFSKEEPLKVNRREISHTWCHFRGVWDGRHLLLWLWSKFGRNADLKSQWMLLHFLFDLGRFCFSD